MLNKVKFNKISGILWFYLIFDSQNCYWMSWRDFQKASTVTICLSDNSWEYFSYKTLIW